MVTNGFPISFFFLHSNFREVFSPITREKYPHFIQVLYIGIPCFTEHPDEIIPTVESILRNGGDDSLRVHVVLTADVAIDSKTKQRVDAVPFGATWKRCDGRFTFTYLNKGLKAFTGKTSSLYLINKVSNTI
jgi:hypothetical protein